MSVLSNLEPLIIDVELAKMGFCENFDDTSRRVIRGSFPELDYTFSRIMTCHADQYFYLYGDVVFEIAFDGQQTPTGTERIVVVYIYGIDASGECCPYWLGNIFELSLYRLAMLVHTNKDVDFDGYAVRRWLVQNSVAVPLTS